MPDSTDVPASLLGKPSDDPEIVALIKLGNGGAPKLPRGETNAYVELKELGITLIFTDEGYQTQNQKLARGEGALLLTSVLYYPQGYRDYTGYAGALPEGLDFAMSQAMARAKLGKSEWDDADLCTEGWKVGDMMVSVGYTDAFDALTDVSVYFPDPDDSE